ncbi:hypothetical protein AYI68_g3541 [Smittium mucronatum]|uniref:Uncharacterized protein n=1 Tax=Smittium mucronatum TaxID=133383 RepID=A0A1R0GZM9_9FUNG|nr:hypothetical protein AYI68_g3541 [Smittium mucronatum]
MEYLRDFIGQNEILYNVIINYTKKYEKKKKTYRKDYYPNYNKLLCWTTDYVPTGKGFNLPTERPPPPGIASNRLDD